MEPLLGLDDDNDSTEMPDNIGVFETKLFKIVNKVRTDPQWLIPHLKTRLTKFMGTSNNLSVTPMKFITTVEGRAGVEAAIKFLDERAKEGKPCDDLIWSDEAATVVAEHTEEICKGAAAGNDARGLITEKAQEKFKKAFEKEFGGEEEVSGHAELHDYGNMDPLDVIMSLVIDDGNKSRSNRANLFGFWDYFGACSREHKKFGKMTSLMFVVSKETADKELDAAVKAAESELGIEDRTKYDWIKKELNIQMNDDGIIIVSIKMLLRDGKEANVEYKYQSKFV